MKKCPNCSAECRNDAIFCHKCGALLDKDKAKDLEEKTEAKKEDGIEQAEVKKEDSIGQKEIERKEAEQKEASAKRELELLAEKSENSNANKKNIQGIPNRNLALCVILSIVTCGIYGIYWMIMLNDEVNQVSEDYKAFSGGMVFLLSLVTCGIYQVYWSYKMGEKIDIIDDTSNGNSNILYLILSIFGLDIVNFCFMQDALNGLSSNRNNN